MFSLSCGAEESKESWEAGVASLEKHVTKGECGEIWNTLWPWAASNSPNRYEARRYLLAYMFPPPFQAKLIAPGDTDDKITRLRNAVVLSSHAEIHSDHPQYPLFKSYYSDFRLEEYAEGRSFLKCTQSENRNCAHILEEANFIPSFEEYADQINKRIETGATAKCNTLNDEGENNE